MEKILSSFKGRSTRMFIRRYVVFIGFSFLFTPVVASCPEGSTATDTHYFGEVCVGSNLTCSSYCNCTGSIQRPFDWDIGDEIAVDLECSTEETGGYFTVETVPPNPSDGVIFAYMNVWCDFDPTIFIIQYSGGYLAPFEPLTFLTTTLEDGYTGDPLYLGGFSAFLKSTDKMLLCSLTDKPSIKIYGEIKYGLHLYGPDNCDYSVSDYEDLGEIGKIKLTINGLEGYCDDQKGASAVGQSKSKCSTGSNRNAYNSDGIGCSSCSSQGLDTGKSIAIGDYNGLVTSRQDTTLNFYGSVIHLYNEPIINYRGFWLRPNSSLNSWKTLEGPQYDENESGEITKMHFTIGSQENYKYYYEITGEWISQAQARQESRGQIPLLYVLDEADNTKFSYSYVDNSKVTITEYQGGQPYNYIVYEGGVNSQDPEDTLKRIWYGRNINDFQPSGQTPSGGRYLDIQADIQPRSGISMLKQVSSCSSCGGSSEYKPARSNQKEDSEERLVASNYLLKNIKNSESDVLVTYSYDLQDRETESWLGDKTHLVKKVKYPEKEGEGTSDWSWNNDEKIVKKYVNNNEYRALVYTYDDTGKVTSYKEYHDVQSTEYPIGSYSETKNEYLKDSSDNITKMITILPMGNVITKCYALCYDDDYVYEVKITKEQRGDIVLLRYEYEDGKPGIPLKRSINESGATTDFTYQFDYSRDVANLTTQIDPAPNVFGKSDGCHDRLTSQYQYDDKDQVTKEWQCYYDNEDTYENIPVGPTTNYTYDQFGNLTFQARGNLTHYYQYNEYNEATKTYDYDSSNQETRNIRRTLYSDTGALSAEAVYLSYTNDTTNAAVSATLYTYNNDGWLTTKQTANEKASFTFSGEAGSITWVSEVYQYDSYGRRTAIIADATGEALTTQYEYNNQNEIVKVIQPDQHFTETIRDGRGLVASVINGSPSEVQATTQYFYDLNGNLTKQIDPSGVTEIYAYDSMDRKTKTHQVK